MYRRLMLALLGKWQNFEKKKINSSLYYICVLGKSLQQWDCLPCMISLWEICLGVWASLSGKPEITHPLTVLSVQASQAGGWQPCRSGPESTAGKVGMLRRSQEMLSTWPSPELSGDAVEEWGLHPAPSPCLLNQFLPSSSATLRSQTCGST